MHHRVRWGIKALTLRTVSWFKNIRLVGAPETVEGGEAVIQLECPIYLGSVWCLPQGNLSETLHSYGEYVTLSVVLHL